MSYQSQQQQVKRKALIKVISGAVNNGGGLVRLTAVAHTFRSEDRITVANVGGTVEANGAKQRITVIGVNTFDLQGSAFVNAYTSGGTATRTQG